MLAAPGAFDPFAVLGLSTASTKDEVKTRFRELAKKHHPDSGTNADAARMEEINRAYNALIKEGMVEQLRNEEQQQSARAREAAAAAGCDDDAATAATLDPTSERISDDGAHFMYLSRETGRWVRRSSPLTKPRQPRYGTFQHDTQAGVDLHDEIRKRQMASQRAEEELTKAQRSVRAHDFALPFNRVPLAILAMGIYGWGFYLLYRRVVDKALVVGDKRVFYYDKLRHREMIEEAYNAFQAECNVAAEAAALVFLAAAMKTVPEEPEQAATPSEVAMRPPWYFSILYNVV